MKIGFDNEKYLVRQSEEIRTRIEAFGKLYLEFGGKLFDDYHASRVLPGFAPDSKIRILSSLAEQAEILLVINSGDIANSRVRGDSGLTYDDDVLRLIDVFREWGLLVGGVAVTRYASQPEADQFKSRVERLGAPVYLLHNIQGYPTNTSLVLSEEGFGRNDYIPTRRPLVVVTAPGAASGKMAVCMSQLYHEYKRGVRAGYSKFETFPIWNLPIDHPVNIAYEAATVDLGDINMIDPFHLAAYGERAVSYNRDIESFPVLRMMLEKIMGVSPYQSPTDMGVNMAGCGITDDGVVCSAARQELLRRYYRVLCEHRQGLCGPEQIDRIELLMNQASTAIADRPVVAAALGKAEATGDPAVALHLADGRMVTGKTSSLLGAASAALLNALKWLGGINDELRLISPTVIEPIQQLKTGRLGSRNPRLHTDETLIALAICAATNPSAELALSRISGLRGAEAHATVILSQVDEDVFRRLGINLTCEPRYENRNLYHK